MVINVPILYISNNETGGDNLSHAFAHRTLMIYRRCMSRLDAHTHKALSFFINLHIEVALPIDASRCILIASSKSGFSRSFLFLFCLSSFSFAAQIFESKNTHVRAQLLKTCACKKWTKHSRAKGGQSIDSIVTAENKKSNILTSIITGILILIFGVTISICRCVKPYWKPLVC